MGETTTSLHPISTKENLHQTKLVNGNAKTSLNTQIVRYFLGFFND
jgi:hypothetical protein